jgi:hypothetical protein
MCQSILECEVLVGTRSAEGIMASGHVNRIKRPNTWLHRPILQNVKKALANPGPSTHGTKPTWPSWSAMSGLGGRPEVAFRSRQDRFLTHIGRGGGAPVRRPSLTVSCGGALVAIG